MMPAPSDGDSARSKTLRIRLAYASETGRGARLTADECAFVSAVLRFYEAQINAVLEMTHRTGGDQ